jgi:hypothetical protein
LDPRASLFSLALVEKLVTSHHIVQTWEMEYIRAELEFLSSDHAPGHQEMKRVSRGYLLMVQLLENRVGERKNRGERQEHFFRGAHGRTCPEGSTSLSEILIRLLSEGREDGAHRSYPSNTSV